MYDFTLLKYSIIINFGIIDFKHLNVCSCLFPATLVSILSCLLRIFMHY